MLNEPWLAFVIIIGILATIGKCLEIKYYHDKFRLVKEELKESILETSNYISFNNPGDNI
jgi:hypothetical protein